MLDLDALAQIDTAFAGGDSLSPPSSCQKYLNERARPEPRSGSGCPHLAGLAE